MLTFPLPDAAASTVSSATTEATTDPAAAPSTLSGSAANYPPGSQPSREQVRHLLFGTTSGIQTTIQLLHKLGYAEPNDWSRLISTGRPNEVMAILTKRVTV